MDSAAVTPESFNLVHLFLHADWVVKGVLLGLACASLGSWAVILDKLVRFAALERAASRFEEQVNSGAPLEEVANEGGKRLAMPF